MGITFYRFWDVLKRKGITQKELKEKKVVSAGTLDKIRHNEYISTESIEKLCMYLDVQPCDIMQMEREEKNQ